MSLGQQRWTIHAVSGAGFPRGNAPDCSAVTSVAVWAGRAVDGGGQAASRAVARGRAGGQPGEPVAARANPVRERPICRKCGPRWGIGSWGDGSTGRWTAGTRWPTGWFGHGRGRDNRTATAARTRAGGRSRQRGRAGTGGRRRAGTGERKQAGTNGERKSAERRENSRYNLTCRRHEIHRIS